MGNWWLAASSSQHNCSYITSFAECLEKHQITQVTQPHYSPDLVPCDWLLAFPKTQTTFEREEILDHWWDSGKYDRAGDSNWENCVRSQGAYFEGDGGIIVLCTMFLESCIFSINVYFSCTWLDTFWTDLMYLMKDKNVGLCRDFWHFLFYYSSSFTSIQN